MKRILMAALAVVILAGCQTTQTASRAEFTADWHKQIGGTYEGFLLSSKQKSRVTTRFRNGDGGVVNGEYVFYENGAAVDGTLTYCEANAYGRLICDWRDKYGAGVLRMDFARSLNQFDGAWGTINVNPTLYWNGRRQ
jgi:hypothetical protein